MYSSMFLFFPATTLLLGSWWGLLICLVLLGLLVWRTALEDQMLKNELAGYQRAASSVGLVGTSSSARAAGYALRGPNRPS